jgi:phage terminase small subunit
LTQSRLPPPPDPNARKLNPRTVDPVTGLNDRQRRFCDEYLIDFRPSKAYLRAGYEATEKAAMTNGSKLLTNECVTAYIAKKMDAAAKRNEIRQDRVIQELAAIAFLDIGDAFNDDGSLKAIKEMPEAVRRAIGGIEVEEIYDGVGKDRVWRGKLHKIKMIDKTKGLDLIGRYLRMWAEKQEGSSTQGSEAVDEMMRAIAASVRSRLAVHQNPKVITVHEIN